MNLSNAKRRPSAIAAKAEHPVDQRETNLARRAEIGEMKRARTRTSLVQAAVRVLGSEQGRLATVDSVISEAGISRGTFYNYFESRDQLLSAVGFELMHDFNSSVRDSLQDESDVTLRTAQWTRRYLHRFRSDANWGWAVVNVSLSGPHLLSEETRQLTLANLEAGMESNDFKVPNIQAVLDFGWGSVLAAAITILHGEAPLDYPEQVCLLILRALGVAERKALHAVSAPLYELPILLQSGD
jgi:AcrR family transcriptional regulator